MNDFIPDEMVDEFREVFKIFDKDGNGSIDMEEFVGTLKTLGQNPTQLELDEMLNDIHVGENGELDFNTFKRLMFRRMKESDGAEDIKDAFVALDTEGAGYITASDLCTTMKRLGEKISTVEAKEMVLAAETRHPGKIEYDEFSHLVRVLVTKH